jgi:hypothetical protein
MKAPQPVKVGVYPTGPLSQLYNGFIMPLITPRC